MSRGRGVHVVLGTTDVSVREGSEFRDTRWSVVLTLKKKKAKTEF